MIRLFAKTKNDIIELELNNDIYTGGEIKFKINNAHFLDTSNTLSLQINTFLYNSDCLVTLLQAINFTRYSNRKIFPMTINIAYLPYGRQDRICHEGEMESLEWIKSLFLSSNSNIKKINIFDPHSDSSFKLNKDKHIRINPLFVPKFPKYNWIKPIKMENDIDYNITNYDLIIAPDKGAYNRFIENESIDKKKIIYCDKLRNKDTGRIEKVTVNGNIKNKKILVIDDICDYGGTFIALGEEFKNHKVKQADLFVSYGIFAEGIDKLKFYYTNIYSTFIFPIGINKIAKTKPSYERYIDSNYKNLSYNNDLFK